MGPVEWSPYTVTRQLRMSWADRDDGNVLAFAYCVASHSSGSRSWRHSALRQHGRVTQYSVVSN